MTPACLAWIDGPEPQGRWGDPEALTLPLADRGLLLADGLFETVLVLEGRPRLLAEHLERWQRSARLLGLADPPSAGRVAALAEEAVSRSGIGSGALRLNWSRGMAEPAASRGIAIPPDCRHRFWLQLTAAAPGFSPVRVIISPSERRCATSLLSRCKTFAYGPSIQARRQAEAAGADDALLLSSAGGLCCGTAATLLVRQQGRWLTPPLASGCLPGVMRQRALQLGLAVEAAMGQLDADALRAGAGGLLLNSLSCRPISHLDGAALAPGAPWDTGNPTPSGPAMPVGQGVGAGDGGAEVKTDAQAQRFWRQLLDP